MSFHPTPVPGLPDLEQWADDNCVAAVIDAVTNGEIWMWPSRSGVTLQFTSKWNHTDDKGVLDLIHSEPVTLASVVEHTIKSVEPTEALAAELERLAALVRRALNDE
jgi:hypothetical protein